MQGNIKLSYALRTPTLARTCAIADYSGHANFVRQGKSPPFIFMDIGFFSKELQCNLLFCARLTWLRPSKPFLQSEHRLVGLLTGTSWDISKQSGGISALRARLSTSLDVNKANGMLTSNAQRTFCHNVTCFRTNNCCSKRSHPPECFIKNPHFLLERVQLSTCFPISLPRVHLAACRYRYLCAALWSQEILLQQEQAGTAGTSHSNKLGYLAHIRWLICSVGAWK